MSLSITISNINDLTEAERAVLQTVLRQWEPKADATVGWTPIDPSLAANVVPAAIITPSNLANLQDKLNSAYAAGIPVEQFATGSPSMLIAPTPTSAAAGTSAELDANGLPWDKRIHSSSRAKVADGRWRYARNVHPALITEVEAELRAVQAIPVPVPPSAAEEFVGTVPSILTDTQKIADGAQTACKLVQAESDMHKDIGDTLGDLIATPLVPPILTEAQIAVGVPVLNNDGTISVPLPTVCGGGGVAPAPAAPLTFADLMKHVTPMLVSGKLPQDTLLAVTAEFGLPHLAALGARPDLFEAVKARIDEVCK